MASDRNVPKSYIIHYPLLLLKLIIPQQTDKNTLQSILIVRNFGSHYVDILKDGKICQSEYELRDSFPFYTAMKSPLINNSFLKPFKICSNIITHFIEYSRNDNKYHQISDREFTFRFIQCLMILNKRLKKHFEAEIRLCEYPLGIFRYIIERMHYIIKQLADDYEYKQDEKLADEEHDLLNFIFLKCVSEYNNNLHLSRINDNVELNKFGELIQEYLNDIRVNILFEMTPIDDLFFIQIKRIMKLQQLSKVTCSGCNVEYFEHKYGKYGKNIYSKIESFNFVDTHKWKLNDDELRRIESIIILHKNNRKYHVVNKWYKCKKCRVKSYCSRKCQKLDWNRVHCIECKSFTPCLNS